MQREITLNLRPSQQLLMLFALCLFASVIIILTLPLSLWSKCFVALLTLVYGGIVFWRVILLRSKTAILSLCSRPETWLLTTPEGSMVATLSGDSTITQWVCLLRFTLPKQRSKRSCLIFRDTIGKEMYRCLLKRLLSS